MQNNEECPQSIIWDAVLFRDWNLVKEECSKCPLNVGYVDGDYDETPLHLAIQNDAPLDVITAIVDAFPGSVRTSSRANRDLPLHLACRYQVKAEILKVLTSRDPATALCETKLGKKPIKILWEKAGAETKITPELWSRVTVMLSAVAKARRQCETQSDEDEKFLLHAAVSLGARSCPSTIIRNLLHGNPKLTGASQRDWSHRLPLHIAVGPTSWSNETRRKYKPRERVFISLLLEAHPKGAYEQETQSNRYPLHLALSNRHCWSEGVSDLMRAAPEVLLLPDPVTKLFPFQLAAIPVGDTCVDLDTVFRLLRSQPNVLGFFEPRQYHQVQGRSLATNWGIYNFPGYIQSFFV
ncbi:unnamed protein product [Cylindrotheca closterium]|uniref:Uncharacterized protein n=1 Tax=Cylindrotheca closterium TaxID=2856 RepID=A0AAD2CHL3_9STRA|nr:unnamed protein product [Cylindrotheca closterium]